MGEPSEAERCPDCGAELVSEPGILGLCTQCLLSLALEDSGASSDPDEAETLHRAVSGRILGDRYQVREMLGKGGMGEVFRAFDLKLRVDVALKAVREGRLENDAAQELLRREVRSAREVVSPNVCRIFDLVEEDGQELVSMEYIDGYTLSETLKERGPLALQESREIASQFLSGLEAIHQAGLVHRDFKPENVMITRAGRVVVMDFGLAKAGSEGSTGTISGTPAYMAPEQARGDAVDARADVFAAGVVLSEMLSVGGEANPEARQALWRAVRETPPRVPDGPWAPVLRQSLASDPRERQASAHALARALEEVTLRLPGFEEKRPYPGLASFTEQDAEYFFGREVEVEAVWKKLKRPRLLALVGPSGAGKSSFLRAGLLPTLPGTWKAVITTPGSHPFQALAETLVPAFSGDTQALQALLRFEDPETAVQLFQRFRKRHEHVVVIVDQFEELFTLNPTEVEEAFARLLGRLVLDADIHVVLSLRDDFLLRCHAHESLAPAFSDLTPLGTLGESGLRRALVQPALACGYRFEDEALVDEMVAGMAMERGALPLLAFAASRLWEKRDRERGLLTREAYTQIGGVAGALAQHAEDTLGRIGTERIPLVRELFRNLVTSQGTRAVRERDELLSVFASEQDPKATAAAGEVLDALIDARLLTSYERAGEGGESHQQVEIIHESLLSAWPRLVRWQTQDADGAQLRDQLRQAAQLWQDRGQHEDLLWSGQAYRDFALWRERYPVPLTATEDAFARALQSNATRRTRRRRATVVAVVGIAVAVATSTSVLWRRAQTETLQAEASKLLVLGERELSTFPTGALAYTLRSLELLDTEAGRLLALRVLQRAPVARLTPISKELAKLAFDVDFSPNGEWVALGGRLKAEVFQRGGEKRLVLVGYGPAPSLMLARFGTGSDTLVADRSGDIRVWSIPDGRELRRAQVDDGPSSLHIRKDGFLTLTAVGQRDLVRSWPTVSGEPLLVGSMEATGIRDATDRVLAYGQGRAVYLRSIEDWSAPPRLVLEQPTEVQGVALSPDGARVATIDAAGEIRTWPTATRSTRPGRVFQAPDTEFLCFDPMGRWLAAPAMVRGHPNIRLFDLTAPPGADPLLLQRGDANFLGLLAFDPSGRWLATAHGNGAAFWPLDSPRALVLRGHRNPISSLLFTPDGKWLLSASEGDNTVRAWPLGDPGSEVRILLKPPLLAPEGMALDLPGKRLAVGSTGRLYVVPLDGGPVQALEGFSEKASLGVPAFDESGRRVAAGAQVGPPDQKMIRVWDLESGAARTFGPLPGAGSGPNGGITRVRFVGQDHLLASVSGVGIVSFDLTSGANHVVAAQPFFIEDFSLSRDGRFGIVTDLEDGGVPGRVVRVNLEDGTTTPLPSHGTHPYAVALDPSDSLVATGSTDGTIRIGPVTGEEPHLLLGHEGGVQAVAFSPDGRWLASAGDEFTIRLWPVPDASKLPLHLRPRAELLSLLRSHTNLRAVPDPVSSTGYKLEPGPFPGWAKPPEW